jgi:deoxycytidine triphosphate deaminase
MFVVGENLRGLIETHDICDEKLFDNHSISINLGDTAFYPKAGEEGSILYGTHNTEDFFQEAPLSSGTLKLAPSQCVLTSSSSNIFMPQGYIGFVQTKGTLARMFVVSQCADPQIEPGFTGKITLEMVNHSPFQVEIPVGQPIAQLFIARCSTNNSTPYSGKYNNAKGPTLPQPFK